MASMDDLADSLASSFAVSNNPNDPSRPHPRFSQYKSRGDQGPSSQEVRRLRTLQTQKKRRDDFISVARALVQGNVEDDISDNEDNIDWMDDSEWAEDQDGDGDSHRQRNWKGPSNVQKLLDRLNLKMTYRNQLMQSEWMVEVPTTLATDWLAMPVPEGRRNLIIAGDGKTKQFSRSGAFVNKFPSLLPGGNRSIGSRGEVTILDTIFSPITRTFYVIDCMVWNQMSYYGCDTEFRWFWISSKLSENPELGRTSRLNPYPFKLLPNYSCDPKSLEQVFNSDPKFEFDPIPLDGILFYHKRVHYLPGVTPLVGWLKGYMLPEILNVQVCEKLGKQRPNNYATMAGYITEYNERQNDRKTRKSEEFKNVEMANVEEAENVKSDDPSKIDD